MRSLSILACECECEADAMRSGVTRARRTSRLDPKRAKREFQDVTCACCIGSSRLDTCTETCTTPYLNIAVVLPLLALRYSGVYVLYCIDLHSAVRVSIIPSVSLPSAHLPAEIEQRVGYENSNKIYIFFCIFCDRLYMHTVPNCDNKCRVSRILRLGMCRNPRSKMRI